MTNTSGGKTESKLPWSVPVRVAEIPEGGRKFELVADETTRADIARFAALRDLPRLTATFEVTRQGPDGLRVEGEISATVGQSCVVTLEPLESDIREEIDLVFAPAASDHADTEEDEDAEIFNPQEPEPLIGGMVDLGGLATEFLIVGIDPYPRKADATFEQLAPADESEHPFAALAALKKGPDNKE